MEEKYLTAKGLKDASIMSSATLSLEV